MKLLIHTQTSTVVLEWISKFHPTIYNGCDYLSMLWLKLKHVSKKGTQLNIRASLQILMPLTLSSAGRYYLGPGDQLINKVTSHEQPKSPVIRLFVQLFVFIIWVTSLCMQDIESSLHKLSVIICYFDIIICYFRYNHDTAEDKTRGFVQYISWFHGNLCEQTRYW